MVDKVNEILQETPGVANVLSIGGFSFLEGAAKSNAATFFVVYDPWEERHDPSLSQEAILGKLRGRFQAEIQEGMMLVFPPPPIRGLGTPDVLRHLRVVELHEERKVLRAPRLDTREGPVEQVGPLGHAGKPNFCRVSPRHVVAEQGTRVTARSMRDFARLLR